MKESNTLRDMKAGNRYITVISVHDNVTLTYSICLSVAAARLRAEVLEAQAKGVQSKQEADPFSRYCLHSMCNTTHC